MSPTIRLLLFYPPVKGGIVGTVVVAVVHSTLAPFTQALIIAIVSGVIGALGIIAAAVISSHSSRRVEEKVDKMGQGVTDVQHKLGADQREKDNSEQ